MNSTLGMGVSIDVGLWLVAFHTIDWRFSMVITINVSDQLELTECTLGGSKLQTPHNHQGMNEFLSLLRTRGLVRYNPARRAACETDCWPFFFGCHFGISLPKGYSVLCYSQLLEYVCEVCSLHD